jgi:hypothetical protein
VPRFPAYRKRHINAMVYNDFFLILPYVVELVWRLIQAECTKNTGFRTISIMTRMLSSHTNLLFLYKISVIHCVDRICRKEYLGKCRCGNLSESLPVIEFRAQNIPGPHMEDSMQTCNDGKLTRRTQLLGHTVRLASGSESDYW